MGAAALSIGDILGKVIGFIILPYLTAHLGASGYGALTLYLSVIQMLIIFISFSGQGLLPVKYMQEGEGSSLVFRRDNITLAIASSVLLVAIFYIVTLVANISVSFSDGFLVVLASLAQALNFINLSHLRISQTYKVAAIGQFLLSAFNVLFTIALFEMIAATPGQRLIAIAASFFSIQLAYEFFVYKRIKGERVVLEPVRKRYKEIISYGVSLLPHHGSYWIKSSIDRFFIAHYMSTAVVGVYGLAFQLTSIVMLFFGVINQAFQPFIYRKLKEKDFRGVELIQYGYTGLVVVACIIYFFIMPFAFPYLFKAEFNRAIYYFNILLPGTAFLSIYYIFTHSLFYYRKNKMISIITMGSMVTHLVGIFIITMTTIKVEYFCFVYAVSSLFACVATFVYGKRQISIERKR
ncbi:Polysaccharide biosynthesis protein [Serratia quinivorans]|uniref:Polysaccharide biosynthesis protein n=2 Tax=Serratia TaxID=613 RepID=A0A2X2GPS8_9GAMM|nr:Polysaccharide biosynthesis protein [Serratia quinivorans]CAI1803921.1 Polysaccharide biosynthesis protein [Serratia quinivorans]SPZ59024.1 Polysaccharide biosynthesis protein [Serratia quinivorans]SUI46314.1 Polysaccharide biosynthesis protein [Serratia quinivorans]VEI66983.1 Polysaccharide biosynthesis protein [Serratia quinivorans]